MHGEATHGMTALGRKERWVALALALAATAAARPAEATVRAAADVSLHVQYRGDTGTLPVIRVTNNSTAGESIGSVRLTPPGPAWSIRACLSGPAGWTITLAAGSCVFRSAAGRQDDIPAVGAGSFQANVDVLAGSINASGFWEVRVATDENVTADSLLASGGEGGLAASAWVWEVLDAVVSTTQVSPGVPCPPMARQALAGTTRTIVVCGRSHADIALTPQAAASTLGGTFLAASGTFASRSAAPGFSGVLATWDGATVTSNPGLHNVRVTVGSSGNATSQSTDLGGYNATPPVPAPELTGTAPASPANANALRVGGRAFPFSTVRLYTDAACSGTLLATGTAADFELNGFAVSAFDNTSTTFYATATDNFGTVSPCSSGLTYVEDSLAPSFAGLRTATALSSRILRLAWRAASDTVSPASDIVYEICRATTPAGCTPFRQDFATTPGALSFDVTGLLPDARSFFIVRARDKAGNRDPNTVQVSGRTLGTKSTVNVSAGLAHACALESDGGVFCWGSNGDGQVGRGTSSRVSEPTLVLRGAVSVSASIGDFTCAVISNGRVRCWGRNDFGQLGDGTNVGKRSPTEVLGISTGVAVSAGAAHACALLADGTVSCWGLNAVGELGNGTKTSSSTPVAVTGLDGEIKAITAGSQHTCALRFQGGVQCWGLNKFGQVGDGTKDNRLTPVDVAPLTFVSAIAAGPWHTCALLANGEVDCWGRGETGQLGNGSTDDHDTPVVVAMPFDAVSITAGGNWNRGWSCAVTAGGFARCWGANYASNFGTGTPTDATPTPTTLTTYPDVAQISTGGDFGCFVLAHGSLLCAGLNDLGQLGDATIPSPALVPEGVNLTWPSMGVQVSSGDRHTCAVVSDGTVRCWGHNGLGRLGDGTTTASSTPVPVTGVGGARSVSAGGAHTCAVVADGTVRCWGYNGSGQLGDGTTDDRTTAVAVNGLSDIVEVAAGSAFTCALDVRGTVWCFGDDSFQQLGDGGWTAQSTPVEVPALPPAIAITAGSNHACALLLDGWASCWGNGASGQLGPIASGGQFGFVPGAIAIAAGQDHTCALLANGTANCWGANTSGQLGDNTTTPSSQPVVVAGITNATAITVAGSHTCALLADSSAQCWGANAVGQLGGGNTLPTAGKVAVRNLGATALDAGIDHTCAMVVDGTISCWGAGANGRLGNGSTSNRSTRVQVTPFP